MATNNAVNNVKPLNVVTVTSDTISIENYTLYVCSYTTGPISFTLPTTAKLGSFFMISMLSTDQIATLHQNVGQQIMGPTTRVTTEGIAGSITITPPSATFFNTYRFYCIEENNKWILDIMNYTSATQPHLYMAYV